MFFLSILLPSSNKWFLILAGISTPTSGKSISHSVKNWLFLQAGSTTFLVQSSANLEFDWPMASGTCRELANDSYLISSFRRKTHDQRYQRKMVESFNPSNGGFHINKRRSSCAAAISKGFYIQTGIWGIVTMCSQCCKISKVQNGTNRNPP